MAAKEDIVYYVYILRSKFFDRFYIGVSGDVDRRLSKHNSGSSKSTRPYKPWDLVYTEEYANKSDAYKREYYLKSSAGYLDKKKILDEIRNGKGGRAV